MTVTLLGQTLDGRYRLDAPLGAGAMGEVYRGTQVSLQRQVAVKILPRRLAAQPDVVQRFEREAQLLSRLKHPGIVSVIDFGWAATRPYLVMELVHGDSLERVLGDDGVLPPERAARVMISLCEALDHAHAMGVLHRDLKPSNILIDEARVRVVDFGVARALEGNANITGEGMVLGTPKYCSPEQAMGLALDGRSDLYAVGVVGWRMLVGRVPFDGDGPAAIFSRHVLEVPPPVADVAKLTPAWRPLGAVIDRLLSKSPGDRYASALEAQRALEVVLEEAERAEPPRPTLSVPPMPELEDGHGLANLDTSGRHAALEGPAATAMERRSPAPAEATSTDPDPPERASPAPEDPGHTVVDDDAHDTLLDNIARPYFESKHEQVDESAFAPTRRSGAQALAAPPRRSWIDRHPGLAAALVLGLVALLAWVATLLSAPPVPSRAGVPLPPLAVEARQLIAKGEAKAAVARLEDAVEKQPKDAALRVALAHAYVRGERAPAAIPHYVWASQRSSAVFDPEHVQDLAALIAQSTSPLEKLELACAQERIGEPADVVAVARAALEDPRCDDRKSAIQLLRDRGDKDVRALLGLAAKATDCGAAEAQHALDDLRR